MKCCRRILAQNFIGKRIFFRDQAGKEKEGLVLGETKELFYILIDNTIKKVVKRLNTFKFDSRLMLLPKEKQALLPPSIWVNGGFLVGDVVERLVKLG